MPGTERDLVSRLLKQSILALCREAVSYNSHLEVDGIVCVTLDNHTDHVVKIHELFSKPEQSNCTSFDAQAGTSKAGGKVDSRLQTTQQQTRPVQQQTVKPIQQYEPKVEPVSTSLDTSQQPSSSARRPLPAREIVPTTEKQEPTAQSLSKSTPAVAQIEVSKARNITCKKCNAVIDDAKKFELHNTDVHSHFTCMVCLATFTSRNNMKRHLRLHTGVKPYTCSKCSESFARNDDYKRHLLRHSFDKPFRCAECKSGYSDRSCVKNHMIKEHGSKIFHICPQCGASYIDAHKFQMHKKTHPEFQDYRCALCSFTGSNSLMYTKHMLTHGTPKRYVCGHCEVTFNDPFSYTNHMKRHKGDDLVQTYICCFCDHVSQTYEQFQRHEHSHIQSKQHPCTICGKQFRYPSNLKEHMLTHMSKSSLTTPTAADDVAKGNGTKEEQPESCGKEDDTSVEDNNDHEAMEEDQPAELEASGSNGSDYWCTECNQGFGTEDLLQDHIMTTHEDIDEFPESPDELPEFRNEINADTQLYENLSTPGRTADDKGEKINPYELNTQVDSPDQSLYEEETRPSAIVVYPIRKRVFEENASVYEEQTQLDTSRTRGPQRIESLTKHGVTSITKRARAFDEETVTDGDARYQDDINSETDLPAKSSPVNFSKVEMAIVEDAMKEVQKIQSRFGIKPQANLVSTTPSAPSSQLRLALNGGKDKVDLRNPTAGIWKSPVSINRSRLWAAPQHDINRNNIPASTAVAEDLTTVRDMIVAAYDDDSKSPEAVYVTKTNTASAEMAGDVTPQQYSKTSVLGMDTDFSATPNRGSPTTLNLKMKSPGFEKVVTPNVLFKDRAPFTCEVCDQMFEVFEGREGFDQHGITVHRRFICSWCGKPFTSRPNRERHVRYHTGEKPYRCDVCSASFFRGDDLKYHRTTKHADIRPFLCGTCKVSFAVPKELEKHLRIYPDHRMTDIIA